MRSILAQVERELDILEHNNTELIKAFVALYLQNDTESAKEALQVLYANVTDNCFIEIAEAIKNGKNIQQAKTTRAKPHGCAKRDLDSREASQRN